MAGFTLIILTCGAFLLFVGVDNAKSYKVPIHKKGYCVWYGQCTSGPKAKNCLYNGPAKPFTDPEGLKVLNRVCPELKGQNTCCSTKQLIALSENLETMVQLTGRCPACWNNMRRLYCQLTCNRDQSMYMDPKHVDNSTGHATILDINYYVSPTFKQGLFESCKDVRFPGTNEKVLNLLCGTTAEKCTAEKLLRYMGNTANGFAPFNIYYPESLVDKLTWMDITVFKCNKPFIDPYTNKTTGVCSCQDCAPSCLSTTSTPRPTLGPKFRAEQLIITSTHPSPTGYVRYGDGKWIPFGPIFHLELLHQALDLQNRITDMKVPFEGSNITLEDICFQPLAPQNTKCAIPSIFQYFQNNITRLNKCITSLGYNCSDPRAQFDFRMGDFHDHLIFCTGYPASPLDERLDLPCLGAFGAPVDPNIALAGFTGNAYKNATTMIITFMVNNYQDQSKMAEVMAWEKSFVEYMKVYINDSSHANLTIHYSTPENVQHKLIV